MYYYYWRFRNMFLILCKMCFPLLYNGTWCKIRGWRILYIFSRTCFFPRRYPTDIEDSLLVIGAVVFHVFTAPLIKRVFIASPIYFYSKDPLREYPVRSLSSISWTDCSIERFIHFDTRISSGVSTVSFT